jgi:hypothetical protein
MNYLYFIVSDTDSDEEREESSEVKPSAVSVLAAELWAFIVTFSIFSAIT